MGRLDRELLHVINNSESAKALKEASKIFRKLERENPQKAIDFAKSIVANTNRNDLREKAEELERIRLLNLSEDTQTKLKAIINKKNEHGLLPFNNLTYSDITTIIQTVGEILNENTGFFDDYYGKWGDRQITENDYKNWLYPELGRVGTITIALSLKCDQEDSPLGYQIIVFNHPSLNYPNLDEQLLFEVARKLDEQQIPLGGTVKNWMDEFHHRK